MRPPDDIYRATVGVRGERRADLGDRAVFRPKVCVHRGTAAPVRSDGNPPCVLTDR